MWSFDAVADAIFEELQRHDLALREEQAVRGLDSLDELALHPIVATGLSRAGFGVLREQPYPAEWRRKGRPASTGVVETMLPERRDRQRCDFVLTERPGESLDDDWLAERSERERLRQASGTLFESVATAAAAAPVAAPGRVFPEDALWLEVKSAAQFDCGSGAAGPSRSYASDLLHGPLADLGKLAADDRVGHAALLLVTFTADEPTAAHDLGVLAHRCLSRNLPIVLPTRRTLAIPDRIGNAACTVFLIGMRRISTARV